jgi:hypothetical protein
MLCGVALFFGGVWAFSEDASAALISALVIAGLVEVWLARGVLQRSRMAWSFLVAMNGVFALSFFFGIPSLAKSTGLGLGAAVVPCMVTFVLTAMLVYARDDV